MLYIINIHISYEYVVKVIMHIPICDWDNTFEITHIESSQQNVNALKTKIEQKIIFRKKIQQKYTYIYMKLFSHELDFAEVEYDKNS